MSFFNPDPKSTRIAQLLRELEHKNEHIQSLRAKLPTDRRGSQTLERAISDAHAILMEAFKSGQTGRDHMLKAVAMKRSAWQWAVAFLRLANIVRRNESSKNDNWQAGLQFVIVDRDAAFEQYKRVALDLEARADAYKLLRRMRLYGYLPQADVDAASYVHGRGKGSQGVREAQRVGSAVGNGQGNVGATGRAPLKRGVALEPRKSGKDDGMAG